MGRRCIICGKRLYKTTGLECPDCSEKLIKKHKKRIYEENIDVRFSGEKK